MAKKKNPNGDKLLYAEKKCSRCGKVIYPTPQWVFKRYVGTRLRWYCKYTCMTAHEREIAEKKKNVQVRV